MKDPQLSGGALLLRLVSYRRSGEPAAERREPTPAEWTSWAAKVYARTIRLSVPPEPIRNSDLVWSEGRLKRPLAIRWGRLAAFHRKARALHLFLLANEKVQTIEGGLPDPTSIWHSAAQRWADTYLDLPGGDIPDGPRTRALLQDLRDQESALRVVLAARSAESEKP